MEQMKRKTHYGIYITAGLITALFFVLGIVFGNFVAYEKANSLDISQKAISVLFDFANSKSLAFSSNETDYCKLEWNYLWEEKIAMGTILASLEEKLGKTNEEVMAQKALYQDVQLKTLNAVQKVNEECDYNWSIIIFFYTNNKEGRGGDYKLSELQGYVLDTVGNEHKESVKVFSFDVNIANRGTTELMDRYNVESAPSVVVDGKLYEGLRVKYEIEKAIG